ncbi:conjugal transfer protein [Stygiolobus caldivivus]|uniref:Uncharacterized protein n=1 Tax=Stygiolobus caldivivus TaxID=2824673 RepID=A0A8D5ZF32_9CREN|nr:conjugal transfer protein [Stygiolobus caldivivus]BCU70018.1 hypothetical protein KN1_13150 [Stygiolobus caldivivus]
MDRLDYVLGILRLAKDLNVEVTATRFQKTFFLVQKELGRDLGYKFIPYYFGPFSKELQDDVYKLERQGFVNVEKVAVEDLVTGALVGFKKAYKVTDKAPVVELDEELKSFVTEKLRMPLNDLLRYVYVKYQEYTALSLIKDEVF